MTDARQQYWCITTIWRITADQDWVRMQWKAVDEAAAAVAAIAAHTIGAGHGGYMMHCS